MNKQTRSPIFVTYYTEGDYEKVANDLLLPTLKRWSLPYDAQKVPNKTNWYANTAYKATFMLEMLKKHQKSVVFLDCDATIEQFPTLFYEIPVEYDMAVHYLDWWKFWHNQEGRGRFDLLSGTMMFSYNEKMIDLAEKYIERCRMVQNPFEQKLLEQLVLENPQIKVYKLPASYTAIVKEDGTIPDYIGKPVILHRNVSRELRNKRR